MSRSGCGVASTQSLRLFTWLSSCWTKDTTSATKVNKVLYHMAAAAAGLNQASKLELELSRCGCVSRLWLLAYRVSPQRYSGRRACRFPADQRHERKTRTRVVRPLVVCPAVPERHHLRGTCLALSLQATDHRLRGCVIPRLLLFSNWPRIFPRPRYARHQHVHERSVTLPAHRIRL